MDAVVARVDRDAAACKCDIAGRMDGVIRRCDFQRSGLDVEIAVFFLVGSDKSVVARIRCDGGFFDPEAVVGVNGVSLCRHGYCSACDDQVVFGGDTMSVLRGHRQSPASVDRQIVVGVNSSVRSVIQCLGAVSGAACESILTALCQCKEHLLRLVDPDAGVVAAVDLCAVQHNEHFGGVVGVHRDIAICERSGHHIVSCVCDHHVSVDRVGALSGNRHSVPGQRDHRSA